MGEFDDGLRGGGLKSQGDNGIKLGFPVRKPPLLDNFLLRLLENEESEKREGEKQKGGKEEDRAKKKKKKKKRKKNTNDLQKFTSHITTEQPKSSSHLRVHMGLAHSERRESILVQKGLENHLHRPVQGDLLCQVLVLSALGAVANGLPGGGSGGNGSGFVFIFEGAALHFALGIAFDGSLGPLWEEKRVRSMLGRKKPKEKEKTHWCS